MLGSALSAATPPRYAGQGLSNATPRYPYFARQWGQEGRVVLRVKVTAGCQAAVVRLQETSGCRLLDKAAIEAIRKWRFLPASPAGGPVAGSVDIPVSFKLTD
ncbi:MAG: energy transducer TonB [Kiloniellales bacterium]